MNPLHRWRGRSGGRIVENTVMLAVMQFSNIFLSMATTGYQTRVFGEDRFNFLSKATMYMAFFQLLIDFGFALSATGKVAKHRENGAYVNRVFTCVTLAKLALICLSCIAMPLIFRGSFTTWQSGLTYWMSLLSVASFALLPDFIYRGFERMSAIALRSVTIKVFATVLIFAFVRKPDQYYMVPMFTVIGNFGAMFLIYRHLYSGLHVWFCKVRFKDFFLEIKESALFFLSRIAGTVYGKANGVVLDWVHLPVGGYNTALMMIDAARNGLVSPIADSIYPHMMKNRDFGIIKKTLKLTLPVMILGCSVVFAVADPFCLWWLKEAAVAAEAAKALKALLPVVVISLPNYILGFPTLVPMGLSKYANMSISFGTVVHLLNLCLLFFLGQVNVVTLGISTGIAEASILIFRLVIIRRHRRDPGMGGERAGGRRKSGKGGMWRKIKRRLCWKLFSYLPKQQDKIVFQSFYGRGYSDSPKAIAEALRRRKSGYRLYWVVKDPAQGETLPEDVKPVEMDSVAAIFHLCTAGVWVDNSRKWAFTQKRKGQFYVQTWHGFPLKRIEKDAEEALPPDYIQAAKKDGANCDLMVSNGSFMTRIYQSAFWYRGPVLEGGFPRNDVLVRGDPEGVARGMNRLRLPENTRFLLYAPTFRKDLSLSAYDVDPKGIVKALSARFGGNWLILAKLHPNIAARAGELHFDPVYLKNVSDYPDIQDLYLLADALLTDYSSVMFDFMVTGKPCFLYAKDLAAYRNDRNFYYGIEELPYPCAENQRELIQSIEGFDLGAQGERIDGFYDRFGIVESGHAADDVAERILTRAR